MAQKQTRDDKNQSAFFAGYQPLAESKGALVLRRTRDPPSRPPSRSAIPCLSQLTLAREEVFGPILSIIPFETEAEALQIANATDYGLGSAVWTSNLSRAHHMVRGIKAGVVHVNTYGGSDITVPLGGVKQSGNGHDKSLHALEKYTDLKTAWFQL
jgi:gamma-glutamyl-gamma-aminobutyraldehyde dehydrogenase